MSGKKRFRPPHSTNPMERKLMEMKQQEELEKEMEDWITNNDLTIKQVTKVVQSNVVWDEYQQLIDTEQSQQQTDINSRTVETLKQLRVHDMQRPDTEHTCSLHHCHPKCINDFKNLPNKHLYNPYLYLCIYWKLHNEEFCNGVFTSDNQNAEAVCPVTGHSKKTIIQTPSNIQQSRNPGSSTKTDWKDIENYNYRDDADNVDRDAEVMMSNYHIDVDCVALGDDLESFRMFTPTTPNGEDKANFNESPVKLRKKRSGTKEANNNSMNTNSKHAQELIKNIRIVDPCITCLRKALDSETNSIKINVLKTCETVIRRLFPGSKRFQEEKKKLLECASKRISTFKRYIKSTKDVPNFIRCFEILYIVPNTYVPILTYISNGEEINEYLRVTLLVWDWSLRAKIQMSAMEVCIASLWASQNGFDYFGRVIIPKNYWMKMRGFIYPITKFRFAGISPQELTAAEMKFKTIVKTLVEDVQYGIEFVNFENNNIVRKKTYNFVEERLLIK